MNPQHRYRNKLENIPRPGTGCHPYLLGVANLGFLLGLTPEKVFSDIRHAIPPGSRRVPDREIRDTINKAFGGFRGDVFFPHPRNTPAIQPRKADLQKLIGQGPFLDGAGFREASPVTLCDDPLRHTVLLLSTLYAPDDLIWIGDKYDAGDRGRTIRTAAEWITYFEEGGTTAPYIMPNPLSGEPGKTQDGRPSFRCDAAVGKYRFVVIEFDKISKEDQFRFWSVVKLFVVALIDSANKSIHAWLDLQKHVQVKTYEQWTQHVKVSLYNRILTPLGLDSSNSNPSRLSRLPGHLRAETGPYQRLLWLSAEGRRVAP